MGEGFDKLIVTLTGLRASFVMMVLSVGMISLSLVGGYAGIELSADMEDKAFYGGFVMMAFSIGVARLNRDQKKLEEIAKEKPNP